MKKLFTEYPEKNELSYYDSMTKFIKINLDKLFGSDPKNAKRDTHTKTHAAVKGSLEIFDFDEEAIKNQLKQICDIPASQIQAISLKQGIFATPKEYPVWLRFANGKDSGQNDYDDDTRAISVKIIGVEGERLSESHESHTQDIIVQNAQIFIVGGIKDYNSFFSALVKARQTNSQTPMICWVLSHPLLLGPLTQTVKRLPKNLLTEHYWSGSAYSLGLKPDFDDSLPGKQPVEYPLVVKYGFTPVDPQKNYAVIPYEKRPGLPKFPWGDRAKALGLDKNTPDNYYRDNLIKDLAKTDACYCWDFGIQVQANTSMSIDDISKAWSDLQSPFITLGRLTIKHQIINLEKQKDFAENLRFSPWNGLAVHRPVGALNRLRKIVYPIAAKYRHENRGVNYQEPNGQENFE